MEKTICAISTPIGNGGISIIRVSGYNSVQIVNKICNKNIANFAPRKLYLAKISTAKFNDNALVVFFKAPNSYTGENMVEIQCHGGIQIAKGILNELIKNGAQLAEAGEFTKIAFINGKISLEKAEGIIDMINAESEAGIKAGYNLLSGKLNYKINTLQNFLTDCLAEMEVALDYPEEDIDYANNKKINNYLNETKYQLEELLLTCSTGRQVKNGVNILILGKPNVGKSSLLNALLGYDRAIVCDIAGTTRDTIEESFNFNGICFNLIDTAGIRKSNNIIENIGIEKAKEIINIADIILIVLDKSNVLQKEDEEILNLCKNKKSILVLNKDDLEEKFNEKSENLRKYNENIIKISASKLNNINALKQKMFDLVVNKNILNSQILITNSRHEEALLNAKNYILSALNGLKNNLELELIILDIKNAWLELGKITGKNSNEEIINTIFSKFCLGK